MKLFYYTVFIIGITTFCGCAYFTNEMRAMRYLNRGKTNKAIEILSKEIVNNPDDSFAYFTRGVVYAKNNEPNKALADYSMAIKFNPEDYYAYYNRSRIYRILKEYKLELADLNKTILIKPNFWIAYLQKGDFFQFINKDYPQALINYDIALKLVPDNANAYYAKARLLYDMKQYQNAFHLFKKAHSISPNNVIICNDYAWRLIMCPNKTYCNIPKAFNLAKDAYKYYRGFVTCDTLAAVYAYKKDFNNAIKYQNQAIEMAERESQYESKTKQEIISDLQKRLNSYKKSQPWTEQPGTYRMGIISESGIMRL